MTTTLRSAALLLATCVGAVACAAAAPVEPAPATSSAPSDAGALVVLPVAEPAWAATPSGPPPRRAESTATLSGSEILLPATIEFETAKATIRPVSHDALLALVELLMAHPELSEIEIGVHSDARGSSEFNLALTRARAGSVRSFLVEHGVAEARLLAVGFGEERPKSAADPAANRRVEILVKRTR